MAEGSTSAKWFLLSAAMLAVVVVVYVWIEHRSAQPVTVHHAMTAAEKNYLSQITVTDAKMSYASNFMGDKLYYLDAQLNNKGPKTVRQLDLRLSFMDPFDEVVLRKTASPVTMKTSPLRGGAARALHLTFENLPAEWNNGPPAIVPTYVSF